MTEEEMNRAAEFIEGCLSRGDMTGLVASVADSLVRIAAAQEKMVEMAQEDMAAQIEEAINSKAETLAQEMSEEKTRRSFIGKK